MKPSEFVDCDAMDLASLVHTGAASPPEILEAAIERIDALNGRINAVVETSFQLARDAAARVDRRLPLAGVPFLAKDMNIDVRGLHLTASCRWLAGLPPAAEDAPLAGRWRAAGLSILGRTNLPEWAEDFVTEPTWRGPTANPWDLARTPGGSSGGAAAAVACGMVPLAHGTDSGGSIRVPAAACGLVGLKPTRGLVPTGPHQDELVGGFNVDHVLTRTVRDSALMLDLTASQEPTSRYPLASRARRYADGLGTVPRKLRIGLALRSPGGVEPEEEIEKAVDEVARVLGQAGHHVSPFEFPPETEIGEPAAVIWMTAIAEEIDHHLARVGRPPAASELESLTRECMRRAGTFGAVDYVRAKRRCAQATRALAIATADVDILLSPATATLPVLTGALDSRTGASEFSAWAEAAYRYAPYTELYNATGQPAISLPLGHSRTGLPIGVHFAAHLGSDDLLLSLAGWLEREMPWRERSAALLRSYL
jgi:amidase